MALFWTLSENIEYNLSNVTHFFINVILSNNVLDIHNNQFIYFLKIKFAVYVLRAAIFHLLITIV